MHSNVVTTHGDGIVVNHHTLDHFVVCNKNIKMTSDITFAQQAIVQESVARIIFSFTKFYGNIQGSIFLFSSLPLSNR